jgi:hypothetical protein
LSFRSLQRHLSRHPLVLVASEEVEVPTGMGSTLRFPKEYFAGRHTYSELLVSSLFYEALSHYAFILVFQLDCLVFSDQVTEWCALGYDYVGAPWVGRSEDDGLVFTGVGNGGFSLRRVQACLDVLRERDRLRHWTDRGAMASRFAALLGRAAGRGLQSALRGETRALAERTRRVLTHARLAAVPEYRNEDLFWAQAASLLPTFRIPPPEIAVRFAFETEPRFCFEFNGERLPFGCHQWRAYDPEFWAGHLAAAI